MWGISAARAESKRSLMLLACAFAIATGLSGCGALDSALFGGGGSSDNQQASTDSGAANADADNADADNADADNADADNGDMATDEEQPAPDQEIVGADEEDQNGNAVRQPQRPVQTAMPRGRGLPGTTITPIRIEGGANTGTAVSTQVAGMRSDLVSLQNKVISNAQRLASLRGMGASSAGMYHEARAHITTRLQMGTTRGNPELVREWNVAQTALDTLSGNINALNALGADVANDSSKSHYELNTIQATFNVSGAVDEDHRQLSVLEDETGQIIVLIDRLLKEVSDDVQRQTTYVANERANLTTLASAIKNGELYGSDLSPTMLAVPAPGSYSGGSTALVTIRFDHPGVAYQQILYTAVAQALQSRPAASFDVIAVSPTRGTVAAVQLSQTEAQRHAQEVLRSMTDMGVPASRLGISSSTDPGISASEVRVFVR